MITIDDSFFVCLREFVLTHRHHPDADARIRSEIEELVSQYPNTEALYADLHIIQRSTFVLDGETGFIKAIK